MCAINHSFFAVSYHGRITLTTRGCDCDWLYFNHVIAAHIQRIQFQCLFWNFNIMNTILQRLKTKIKKRKKICALLTFIIICEYYETLLGRKICVKSWIERRKEKGCNHNLFLELQLENPNNSEGNRLNIVFRNYFL